MDKLDRSFDGLAERFEKRIYGSLKGKIRRAILHRDLFEHVPLSKQKMKIIDIGAGLGQVCLELAVRGHHVIYNDISLEMMSKAKTHAQELGLADKIEWNNFSYQQYLTQTSSKFDLIICHALLEWLEYPQHLLPTLVKHLHAGAYLSLCFYNPAGLVLRNLIFGNFKLATTVFDMKPDVGSLTPRQSSSLEEVRRWLAECNMEIISHTGIRVFSDYVMSKRGGNTLPEEILKMELEYSQREPFKQIGRYTHLICRVKSY